MVQYIGIDKERYDAGNKFLSQDPYLQNYQNKAAITFNPSRSNTGIMSQYPGGKLLKIPLYGSDGDGGGPLGPGGPDYGYTGPGSTKSPEGFDIDVIGEGTIDDSDMPKGPGLSLMDMVRAGGAFMVGGPFNTIGSLGMSNRRNEQREKDRLNEEIDRTYGKTKAQFADIRDGSAPSGGTWSGGGGAAYSNPSTGIGGGEFTDSLGNTDYQDALDPGGGEKDGGFIDGTNRRIDFSNGGLSRAGYKDGYSVQDDMTDYATNVGREANLDGGFKDSGGGGDGGNPPPSYSNNESPNTTFQEIERMNPSFNYANDFGRLGGLLDLTRTIQEEEPVGNIGYLDPSGNFGIGYNTDLGTVGNANLGNFNLGYTGVGGPTVDYMGGFAGDAGRFNANYNRDTGLNFGLNFNYKFNNGGIVGLYR